MSERKWRCSPILDQTMISFAVFLAAVFAGIAAVGFPKARFLTTAAISYFTLSLLIQAVLSSAGRRQSREREEMIRRFEDTVALSEQRAKELAAKAIQESLFRTSAEPPSPRERAILDVLGEGLNEFFQEYEFLSIGDIRIQRDDLRPSQADPRWIHVGWNPQDHVEIVAGPEMSWVAELENDVDSSEPREWLIFPSIYHYILFCHH